MNVHEHVCLCYCEIGWVGGSMGFDPAPRARQVWPGLAIDLVESQG